METKSRADDAYCGVAFSVSTAASARATATVPRMNIQRRWTMRQ
nr:hypothetical protein [Nocardioides houyundeii]